MLDGLQEIFTLRQNKLRTLLTASGVLGHFHVVVFGAGRGMQNGVRRLRLDVLDFIIVWTGTTTTAYAACHPGGPFAHPGGHRCGRQQVSGIRLLSLSDSSRRRQHQLPG
jgi:hypothetical protein